MANKKGAKKRGGRVAGTPNKATAEIRAMINEALELEGGVDYLRTQAREKPMGFMTLIAKIIPAEVNAKLTGHFTVITAIPETELDG